MLAPASLENEQSYWLTRSFSLDTDPFCPIPVYWEGINQPRSAGVGRS